MLYSKKKFDLSPKLKLGVGRGNNQTKILKILGALFLLASVALTAHALSLLLNHSTTSKNTSPQVLDATDQSAQSANMQVIDYKVQKGDTLFNLSQKYNINWTTL